MTSDSTFIFRQLLTRDDSGEMSAVSQRDSWITLNAVNHSGDFERFARMQEQLSAFLKIASLIGSNASLDKVLSTICDKTTQLMRAERSTIFLVDHDNTDEPTLSSFIAEKSDGIRLKFGQGIAGTVAQKRQLLNIENVYQCSLFDPSFDKKSGFVTRSCLAMPILNIQNELLGVVQVINKINGPFDVNDEGMIASICSQIGVSLTQHAFIASLNDKNEELLEARHLLQQKNEELDRLYALERDAAVAMNLDTLVKRMLNHCFSAFNTQFAALLIYNESEIIRFDMTSLDECKKLSIDKRPSFIPQTLPIDGISLSIRDLENLPELTENSFNIPLNALFILPLSHDEKHIGSLILGSQITNPSSFFNNKKLALLFAANIASALHTQMNRDENEKKQRLSMIGKMLSNLMHDMKTPLTNISGYSEMMVIQNDPDKRAQFAEVIDRQLNSLKNMSSEIMQYAKGESAIILKPAPLHDVIIQAIDLLNPEAQKRNIKLSFSDDYTSKIPYDFDKLLRVCVNLIRNAIEAIDSDGHINISTATDDSSAILTITDDGPGIPKSISNTLFNEFVTYGKRGGTGLGLAIVKKIIDEHHASIDCINLIPHGTSFIIHLPLI